MRRSQPWIWGSVVTLAAGLLGGAPAVRPAAPADEASPWIMDYEAAKAAARRSERPIFLVFR